MLGCERVRRAVLCSSRFIDGVHAMFVSAIPKIPIFSFVIAWQV